MVRLHQYSTLTEKGAIGDTHHDPRDPDFESNLFRHNSRNPGNHNNPVRHTPSNPDSDNRDNHRGMSNNHKDKGRSSYKYLGNKLVEPPQLLGE